MDDAPHSRRYLPLRNLDWRIVIGVAVLNTLCLFSYRQLDYVANGGSRSALLTFLDEATGGLAGLAVFPLIYLAATHFPLVSAKWHRNLAVHLVTVCLISIVHTTLIVVSRVTLFPLLGFANEGAGYLPARYAMEFSNFFIYYWMILGLIYLFHTVRFARDRELQNAKLESSLAEAQLQNLRLQLEPHFLFNTLNAISAALYEDVRLADEMIGRLGELLDGRKRYFGEIDGEVGGRFLNPRTVKKLLKAWRGGKRGTVGLKKGGDFGVDLAGILIAHRTHCDPTPSRCPAKLQDRRQKQRTTPRWSCCSNWSLGDSNS